MTDPLSRLSAALDEDERIARAASGGSPNWTALDCDVVGGAITPAQPEYGFAADGECIIVRDEGVPTRDEAVHIASQDPARVLSGELPLKRLILRDHQPQEMDDGTYCVECSTSLSLNIDEVPWPCKYIHALAGIYTTEEQQ